jgi:hypothetical protein
MSKPKYQMNVKAQNPNFDSAFLMVWAFWHLDFVIWHSVAKSEKLHIKPLNSDHA